ncbi:MULTISPECIES: virulence factor SrfC family protein [unclassified Desulfovibrio]|uniref:virulence factor SrfC family protein n=1 Tax=unclassified Desulfovibrio TaxID=2593640 RepID=UPI0013ED6D7C|nr:MULTISPECIES: virulence factor SrfC family protein [unclassified Desulfovibrio]
MELATYCADLAEACTDAGAWVSRNGELVRGEQEGLLKELRRAARVFRRCSRAAGRKMCAGVFGPSQAGKSYLISALARDAGHSLLAVFGNATKDFISEINPEGGKESTGLVTRFTMTQPKDLPPDHPVQIRLLSETDLVKIIANTYYADCEHKEAPQSDIEATLKALKQRAQSLPAGSGSPSADLDALEDLREYLVKDFRAKARVQELERSYWDQALALGPVLDLEGRVRLYSLIWDEVAPFTDLLRQLLKALDSLGYAERAYLPLDALIPRDTSIIDVATLAGLDDPERARAEGSLDVLTPAGVHASLPRAVVTALTAELTIVMREKPAPYFDHTDLLDFPGYRSRYKLDDVRRELGKEGMLKELFLRGKVAYLFQRYCAERELTSMLLCIGPSNQEVQDLPGVIDEWVRTTHGERPEDRAGRPPSLFFILTKFDMEFEDKKGAPSLESRWDNRLHASLLDFFGKQHDWPAHWTPERGFDNIFLLRNPNFRFDAVMEYDGDQEKGIRPERQDYVGRLQSAFLQSPLVAAHFREPARAWDEAMKLNDGGITYIRESLSPLCNPDIKRDQLLQNVQATREAVERRLAAFYRTDDREEIRKQKLQLIHNLFNRLGQLETQQGRMGQLLHSLTISDADIADMHPEATRRYLELADAEPADAAPAGAEPLPELDMDTVNVASWNPFAGTPESAPQAAEAPAKSAAAPADEAAFFAAYVESRWIERLHQLADDAASQKYFLLPGKEFSDLVNELSTGAARLALRDAMAEAFRRASAYANTSRESIARKEAGIAAGILNSYVDWLGLDPRTHDEKARTVALPGSKSAVVFPPLPAVEGVPQLGEARSAWSRRWLGDWLNALAALIMGNVDFDGEQTLNVEENMALGAILRRLGDEAAKAPAAAAGATA